MSLPRSIGRGTSAVVLVVLGSTLHACGDDDRGLGDQEAGTLVERVLSDLDLPGESEQPPEQSELPEGELEFGFHCHIESAGFAIDDVLVAFPSPRVGHQEFPDGDIERVEAALLVFDSAATATNVLAAYETEDTADCLSRTFSEPVRVEVAEPLQVEDATADGFAISMGVGEVQPDGHRTFAAVVGRILVEVSVLAPDESRGRELAAEVLGQLVEDLRAGGA